MTPVSQYAQRVKIKERENSFGLWRNGILG